MKLGNAFFHTCKNGVKRAGVVNCNYVFCALGRNVFGALELHFVNGSYKRIKYNLDKAVSFVMLYLGIIELFQFAFSFTISITD